MKRPVLRMRKVNMIFGGARVLDDFNLTLYNGEILALVGESGVGKSTVLNLLGGSLQPSSGAITVGEQEYPLLTVPLAQRAGIGYVRENLDYIANLDVASNIFLGREMTKLGVFDWVDERRMHERCRPLLDRVGLNIDPARPMNRLSVEEQQLVKIAQALAADPAILLMDKPTDCLHDRRARRVHELMRRMRDAGHSVIFTGNRLDEIAACADRAVCVRDGAVAGELAGDEITVENLEKLIHVEYETEENYRIPKPPQTGFTFSVRNLRTRSYHQHRVNLDAHSGEILGMAGVVGAGRSEIAMAVCGMDPREEGDIYLDREKLDIRSYRDAQRLGIFLAPEDRLHHGVIPDMSVKDNLLLTYLPANRSRFFTTKNDDAYAAQMMKRFSIACPSPDTPVRSVSAASQQKILMARWMTLRPKVMIIDEPTRGVRAESKPDIYRIIKESAAAGCAVIVISSAHDEIARLSDRVAVFRQGRLVRTLESDDIQTETIVEWATGKQPEVEKA